MAPADRILFMQASQMLTFLAAIAEIDAEQTEITTREPVSGASVVITLQDLVRRLDAVSGMQPRSVTVSFDG